MATSDRAAAGLRSDASAERQKEDPAVRRARRIAEYQGHVRASVAAITLGAPALEDLADSFPGLLFALADPVGDERQRVLGIELVRHGASLRHVADAMGIPMWMKRLPAAAFTETLPRFPCDADFALRIGSFIPNDRRRVAGWLLGVGDSHLVGGREFALWTARAWSTIVAAVPTNRAGLLPAWYWCCLEPGSHGHALLRGTYDPAWSIAALADVFNGWLRRIALVEWLGEGDLEPWIADAQVGQYEFRMLRRAEDFIQAAAELDNCLEQFAGRLSNGVSTVAKISRHGRIVACVEVGLHETDTTMPAIVQLRGHKNKRMPAELWRKCYDWLSRSPIEPFQPDRLTPSAESRTAAREALWGPFLAALEAHADPAGRVAAVRMRRTLVPKLRTSPMAARRPPVPAVPVTAVETLHDRPATMLQRVREHLASLAGVSTDDHELLRWDALHHLEHALRPRR